MASRIEGLSVAAIVAAVGAVYALTIYYAPDTPTTTAPRSTNVTQSVSVAAAYFLYPFKALAPHVHLPFIPLAYVFSFLYTALLPIIVVLRVIGYCFYAPFALLVSLARSLYPIYVFLGAAAIIALGLGSCFGGLARVLWFVFDAK